VHHPDGSPDLPLRFYWEISNLTNFRLSAECNRPGRVVAAIHERSQRPNRTGRLIQHGSESIRGHPSFLSHIRELTQSIGNEKYWRKWAQHEASSNRSMFRESAIHGSNTIQLYCLIWQQVICAWKLVGAIRHRRKGAQPLNMGLALNIFQALHAHSRRQWKDRRSAAEGFNFWVLISGVQRVKKNPILVAKLLRFHLIR
jgi:hypothetical protein